MKYFITVRMVFTITIFKESLSLSTTDLAYITTAFIKSLLKDIVNLFKYIFLVKFHYAIIFMCDYTENELSIIDRSPSCTEIVTKLGI